jgi:putative FmdB family regulatory protein
MPIYEYVCRACQHPFEQLIRTGHTAACPSCQSQDLERQLSIAAVSSDGIRQANLVQGRKARENTQKGHQEHQRDALRNHIAEGH